jgi:hypothetical protein
MLTEKDKVEVGYTHLAASRIVSTHLQNVTPASRFAGIFRLRKPCK